MRTIDQGARPSRPTAEWEREFGLWRAVALRRAPYLASLLFEVAPLDAPSLQTMGVDRHFRLYVDFEHVAEWGTQMCAEVLLHEAMHLMWRHGDLADQARVDTAHRTIWNVAADISGNDDLRDMGAHRMVQRGLLPEKVGLPDYDTATSYFRQLVERLPPQPQSADDGDPGDQDGSGPGDSAPSGGDGAAQRGPGPLCGGGSGVGLPESWELDETDDAGGYAPAVPPILRDTVREQVVQDLESHLKNQGDGPSRALEDLKAEMNAPSHTPWERVLQRFLSRAVTLGSTGGPEFDYTRRSRRRHNATITVDGQERRLFVPATASAMPRVVVARDTSGSMSGQDLVAANREVMALISRVGVEDDEVLSADVDTEVAATRTVRTARDLAAVHGRGGTDMCEAIRWADGLRPRPSCVVVITDGGTEWPAERSRTPVVACVVGDDMTTSDARDGVWGSSIPDHISVIGVDTASLNH